MLVESGLVLALQADKIKVGGGIWTPATCQVGRVEIVDIMRNNC